jgi:hypothetical protein
MVSEQLGNVKSDQRTCTIHVLYLSLGKQNPQFLLRQQLDVLNRFHVAGRNTREKPLALAAPEMPMDRRGGE